MLSSVGPRHSYPSSGQLIHRAEPSVPSRGGASETLRKELSAVTGITATVAAANSLRCRRRIRPKAAVLHGSQLREEVEASGGAGSSSSSSTPDGRSSDAKKTVPWGSHVNSSSLADQAVAKVLPGFMQEWCLETALLLKPLLIAVYLVNDVSLYFVGDVATHHYRKETVLFASNLCSIGFCTVWIWLRYGRRAVARTWRPIGIVKLLPVSACFFLSNIAQLNAFYFFDGTFIKLFGQTKLPLTALLAWTFLQRRYTMEQWQILLMLTVACWLFTVMKLHGISVNPALGSPILWQGVLCVSVWVVLNVVGTLLAERAFKSRRHTFTTIMLRLHAGKVLASGVVLAWKRVSNFQTFFSGWDWTTVLVLLTFLQDAWLSGAMVKQLSSVTKSVVKCVSLVLLYAVALMRQQQSFSLQQVLAGVLILQGFLMFAGSKSPVPAHKQSPPPHSASAAAAEGH